MALHRHRRCRLTPAEKRGRAQRPARTANDLTEKLWQRGIRLYRRPQWLIDADERQAKKRRALYGPRFFPSLGPVA